MNNNYIVARNLELSIELRLQKMVDLNTARQFASKPLTFVAQSGLKVKFRKSSDGKSWVLGNIPVDLIELVYLGLFKHGCTYLGEFVDKNNKIWVNFKCSDQTLLAKFALNFACPHGSEPQIIGGTPEKPILLYGIAAKKAKLARVQRMEE